MWGQMKGHQLWIIERAILAVTDREPVDGYKEVKPFWGKSFVIFVVYGIGGVNSEPSQQVAVMLGSCKKL